jgi:hypothetical protein
MINGMYVCVLGIPKGKFSKQMEKKLSYRIIRSLLMYNLDQELLFVCEWIGPGYT